MIRALVACLLLGGCAAIPPAGHGETLMSVRALDQRVANVAWRLLTGNADLCPDTKPLTGFTLHGTAQYGGDSRVEAVTTFSLSDAPAVQTIAKGSPAEAAELRVDDHIISADGADLRDRDLSARPSFAHLEAVYGAIDAAAADGEVSLGIRRADHPTEVMLRPVTGCAYLVQVLPSTAVNAWADGRSVTITSAWTRHAARDEDLALILGHELAHNLLRHPLAPSQAREREADRVGAYLAARAGYDLSGAADYWRRFGEDHRTAAFFIRTHPSAADRSAALAKVVAEIEARKAAGAPLIP